MTFVAIHVVAALGGDRLLLCLLGALDTDQIFTDF